MAKHTRDKEMTIQITMCPHEHDNKHKPYFWVIMQTCEDGSKFNTGLCGWQITPQQAWQEAIETYNNFVEEDF